MLSMAFYFPIKIETKTFVENAFMKNRTKLLRPIGPGCVSVNIKNNATYFAKVRGKC